MHNKDRKNIIKLLNGGTHKMITQPVVVTPETQSWFWTKEWQKGEQQTENNIVNGKIKKFNSSEALFKDLDN